MKKKMLSALLATVLVLSGLTGCGSDEGSSGQAGTSDTESEGSASNAGEAGGEESGSGAEEAGGQESGSDAGNADDGVTITLAHGQGDVTAAVLKKIAAQWEEKTGNRVEFIDVASDGIEQWVTAQLTAGTEPDIIWWEGLPKDDYFRQGKILDLTDYYASENVHNGIKWEDCFLDGALKGCMDEKRERYIGVTTSRAEVKLYYNIDRMNELGLGTTAPSNVGELMDMMKAVKEDGRYIPMSVMNSMSWNLGWLSNTFTQSLYERENTELFDRLNIITENGQIDYPEMAAGLLAGLIGYDDPEIVEYHRIMKEMSRYFNEDFNAVSWEYEALFNEGESVFNFNGGRYPGQVIANEIDINWGAADIPYIDNQVSELGRSRGFNLEPSSGECHLFVSQKCADEGKADAAVSLLMYYTDYRTGAQTMIDELLIMPTVKDLRYPDSLAALAPKAGSEGQEYDTLKGYDGMWSLSSEMAAKYWEMYTDYLDPATDITAEDFCKQMKEELMPLVEDYVADKASEVDIMSYVEQLKL